MQNTYFDQKGIIEHFNRIGKFWDASSFTDLSNLGFLDSFAESEIVRHGQITWIPSSWVRQYFEMMSASPSHALERYQALECEVIQWMPSGKPVNVKTMEQNYARAQKIN